MSSSHGRTHATSPRWQRLARSAWLCLFGVFTFAGCGPGLEPPNAGTASPRSTSDAGLPQAGTAASLGSNSAGAAASATAGTGLVTPGSAGRAGGGGASATQDGGGDDAGADDAGVDP